MRRFPELAKMFSLHDESDIPEDIPAHLLAPIEILPSRQGVPTAKDGGKLLHSLYNPVREAEQAARAAKSSVSESGRGECCGCAFFSFGLGYAPLAYARLFPRDTLILVESDPRYFFTALSLTDFSPIFGLGNCIIALGAGIDFVVPLIERAGGVLRTAICENAAQSAHAGDYFSALRSLLERNRRKEEINASTLEKFSSLWLRNTCRNLHFLAELDGISIFKDSCPAGLPAVILAAGPTLEEILPHLSRVRERAVVIAVDTALRACLRAGVEPDFIVLADPQYYAFRHIAGLSSPSSILITESAAYPAVFRFKCRKIVLCASLFPLGAYIESKIGSKGALVAGGSVATTSWDFARFIGAREILCAGLDLGFPRMQTHIRGSTFEESVHAVSNRIRPAEILGSRILFGADIKSGLDYAGGKILTDSKMRMFAWWFESRAEEFKDTIKSFSLSEKSLRIPNFSVMTIDELLALPEKSAQREEFFKSAEARALFSDDGSFSAPAGDGINGSGSMPHPERRKMQESFGLALGSLRAGLSELAAAARKGLRLADEGIRSPNPGRSLAALERIDAQILHSEYKEIVSLVFPSERKLTALFESLPPQGDEIKSSLQKSKVIYTELARSVADYQKFF